MYLHLGKGEVVRHEDIVAIFDLDNSSYSHITREYLACAEKAGEVFSTCDDLPKSFVLARGDTGQRVFLSQLAPSTLMNRLNSSASINF